MCAAASRAPAVARARLSQQEFELADGVVEQAAQRPQPHPRLAEVGLRDGLVLLCDALVGQYALGKPLGVDVGGSLGTAERGHRRQQRQRGHHRPAVGVGVVQRRTGRGALVDVGDAHQAVSGDERVGDDDVVEPVAHIPSVCQTSSMAGSAIGNSASAG